MGTRLILVIRPPRKSTSNDLEILILSKDIAWANQYLDQVEINNTEPPFASYQILFIEEDLREVVQEEISIKKRATLKMIRTDLMLYMLNTGS